MPLIDLSATTKIAIGDDWYELRNELGFYAETIMLVNAVDPNELKSFELIDDENGIVKSKQTPGEMVARRNSVKLRAYLIAWSHVEIVDTQEFLDAKESLKSQRKLLTKNFIKTEKNENEIVNQQIYSITAQIEQLNTKIKEAENTYISVPVTLKNIKRISGEDAKILMNKIEELEDSIPVPFRDEDEGGKGEKEGE